MRTQLIRNVLPPPQNGNDAPFAVIAGLACLQGLKAARILSAHKVPVLAITDDHSHYCSQTNTCRKIYLANTKSNEFVQLLEHLGPALHQKAVLIPCHDETVHQISKNRLSLQRWYHFLLPDADTVELLLNKRRFYEFAQEQGMPIPETRFVRSQAELERVAGTLNYPCVLKPPERSESWNNGSRHKAYRANSPEELMKLYVHCQEWETDMLVQEWVAGGDDRLYSCNCYYNTASKPLVTFVARKIRQWPPQIGESCLGEECRNEAVLQETLRLFGRVGFKGLGYLEMKQDARDNKMYMIEPNIGRPTGRSAIAEAGGVALLYTLYCDLLGRPLPENRQQRYEGVKWIHVTRDFASAAYAWHRKELSLKAWLDSWRGKKDFAVFSFRDPQPFLAELAWLMARVLRLRKTNRRSAYQSKKLLGHS